MTLLVPDRTAATAADVESGPEGHPRPRRRRGVWAVALIVVLAAVLGGYLAQPRLVRFAPNVTPAISGPERLVVEEFGEDGTQFVRYTHGQEFVVTVPLTNNAPLPITVSDIRLADEIRPLVTTRSVSVDGGGLPVSLAPGETASVELTARFGNCRYYHERAVQTMPGALVRGSVLGREFRKLARFDHPLAVHSQVILRCPDRTLVRGDDIRGDGPAPGRGNAG